jgi:hypothetical protein
MAICGRRLAHKAPVVPIIKHQCKRSNMTAVPDLNHTQSKGGSETNKRSYLK